LPIHLTYDKSTTTTFNFLLTAGAKFEELQVKVLVFRSSKKNAQTDQQACQHFFNKS